MATQAVQRQLEDDAYDDEGRLRVSRKRIVVLASISTMWMLVDSVPLVPFGFLYAAWWVGSNCDRSFFRSLVTGYRALGAGALGMGLGLLIGPSVNIFKGGFMLRLGAW